MSEGQAPEPRPQRARLGQELQRLRMLAGLSGTQLANALGLSQSRVSRIERGQAPLTLAQVNAWADATGASEERRTLVLYLTEAVVNEVITHAERFEGWGLAGEQQVVQRDEETARVLRHFQPCFVSGLLQTAEYARRILTFSDPNADIAQALAVRMARQRVLYEPGRELEFILTEAALRYQPGEGDVLTAQHAHLASVATLETVSIGVIPAGAQMHALVQSAFIIYDDRADGRPAFAKVETPHASISASEPADVQVYRDRMVAYRRSAIFGDEGIDFIRAIARERNP
jgi:transcriptional regulator with XRE-family HTH domain